METEKKTRALWKDWEVKELISIIAEKYTHPLLKHKQTSLRLWTDIAKDLAQRNVFKKDYQIRQKYFKLKCEYLKIKRSQSTKGVNRHACEFYNMLEKMFTHHSQSASVFPKTFEEEPIEIKSESQQSVESRNDSDETETETETETEKTNYLEAHDRFQITTLDNQTLIKSEEFLSSLNGVWNEGTTDQEVDSSSYKDQSVHADSTKIENPTYEELVENFTKEWEETQKDLIETMRQHDKEYLGNVQSIFERNIKETEIILENDRRETAKMFETFLRTLETNSNSLNSALPSVSTLDSDSQHQLRILSSTLIKKDLE